MSTQNLLLKNRVFADVIMLRSGHTGLMMLLNPVTGVGYNETGIWGEEKDRF